VVFLNIQGFWNPLFELFHHTIEARLTPESFARAWISVDRPEDMLPAFKAAAGGA
jgi:predicted Rossmann-fold nucleotide-binding protein